MGSIVFGSVVLRMANARSPADLAERLPPKIQRIQKEVPIWIQRTGNKEAAALVQELSVQMNAKNWVEVETIADSILMLMGGKP